MTSDFDIYRRTLTSAEETETAWWYLGTTTIAIDGHPEIVVNHVETVMIYGSKSLGGDSYRLPWWEIGLFRDAITGEIASNWKNPVTGELLSAARTFEEGPSGYSIRSRRDGGIEMFDAVQAFARLENASIAVRRDGGRVSITQTEEKVRSFPGLDGIPDLDKGEGTRSKTVLQWFADIADIQTDSPSVPSTGTYSFEIGAPAWLGFGDRPSRFMVKGLMQKASLETPLNPRGWQDLKTLFPQYFSRDEIQPRWV